MQQPQTRPLLGDSVSSTTSSAAHSSNNPIAVLTPQQLQQLQQLQSQNSAGHPVTFTLQQASGNAHDQSNAGATGNPILYLNQLNQLGSTINASGTSMGIPSGTPTFGVGLNMGLPLSILNTNLTSNAMTTSNPLLNLSIPNLSSGLTALNPGINQLNTISANLNPSLPPDSISNGLSNLGSDLNSINSINRISTLNSANIATGLSNINALTTVNANLTNLNTAAINQNLSNLNTNQNTINVGNSAWNTLGSNINLSAASINQQGINKTFTNNSSQFPLQTIQSIQNIAPHIVGSSVANIVSSGIAQNQNNVLSSSGQTLNSGSSTTSTCTEPILATTTNTNQGSNFNQLQFSLMSPNLANMFASQVNANDANQNANGGFQNQFSTQNLTQANNVANQNNALHNIKSVQGIQNQSSTSPGSPFSIPMKSPVPSVAPPTPSPSPNRLLLRSPAPNSVQARNSPSPVSTSNSNFNAQMMSPMQSPLSVGRNNNSPISSTYPPAKSPHHLNSKSPVAGTSPGPTIVRPNTPILQHGMQVLQIIHGPQQTYPQAQTQLVTRTPLFGNQQIQIATAKPIKQPPQILPKPPLQQANISTQQNKKATTVANQITQPTQPQIVLANTQPTHQTATVFPTAQGLLQFNQVLPSTGPVIVQQPGGVQLILRTPTNTQQQAHTAQLTQQQLVRVVTAQGMHLQGITPTFFAVPNGFTSATNQVIRQTTTTTTASQNTVNNSSLVIQNPVVQNSPTPIQPTTAVNTTNNSQSSGDQNLLPPPKKKAKKKKKIKKKENELPKLDLASIMKISGIGDDDDMLDSDIASESMVIPQTPQIESNHLQNNVTISPPQQVRQNILEVPVSNSKTVLQTNPLPEDSSNTTQIQAPVQNTISGQLRLSIGEDGRIILHHTPEPNQPEIDQATAQALIRTLTHGGGQNSQFLTQLLQGQSVLHIVQSPKPKVDKVQNLNTSHNLSSVSTTQSSAQNENICTNPQNNLVVNNQNVSSSPQSITVTQNKSQNKCISLSRKPSNIKVQNITDVKMCQKNIAKNNFPNQLIINAQGTNNQHNKCNQSNIQNKGLAIQANIEKKQIITQIQKPVTCLNIQKNIQLIKTGQNISHIDHQDNLMTSSSAEASQQNLLSPKLSVNNTSIQNVHQLSEQNSQQNNLNNMADVIKFDSNNMIQQQQQQQSHIFLHPQITQFQSSQDHHQQTQNSLAQHSQHQQQPLQQQQPQLQQQPQQQQQQHHQQQQQQHQQQQQQQLQLQLQQLQQNQQQKIINLQQNIANNIQSLEQSIKINAEAQISHCTNITHQNQTLNNLNSLKGNSKQITVGSNNNQQLEIQNLQGNILISNSPCTGNQTGIQKSEVSSMNFESPAATFMAQSSKITPELINCMSGLKPTDQILIATGNGQMQLVSQPALQKYITDQLNAQSPQSNQNQQSQKIIIGDPDTNSQNLQGLQINTPTSQIIVNSSGGAPTIQNNIQNIVVQAAPTNIPQQIQIQNSNFPSQFIDNLNQQQIRNLGTNQTINQGSIPKKTKILKKAKVVSVSQGTINVQHTAKNIAVSRAVPIVSSTSSASSTTNTPSVSISNKSELPKINLNSNIHIAQPNLNGPIKLISTNLQLSGSGNNNLPHRIQAIIPPHKQNILRNLQIRIQKILAKKVKTQDDKIMLNKLHAEQAEILSTAKIISTIPQMSTSESESTSNANSASSRNLNASVNVSKNQPSVPAHNLVTTPMSTASLEAQNHNLISMNTSAVSNASFSTNEVYLSNIPQNIQNKQGTPIITNQTMQLIQSKVQKNIIPHLDNLEEMAESDSPLQNFDNMQLIQTNRTSSSTCTHNQLQQSIQCQTEIQDEQQNIEALNKKLDKTSNLNQLPEHNQNHSPAGQVQEMMSIDSKAQIPVADPFSINIKRSMSSDDILNELADSLPQDVKDSRELLENKIEVFETRLKMDHESVVNPDVNTPFVNKMDACDRLVKYHCFNEKVLSAKDLEKADDLFEETAKHLLTKFKSMVNKYTYLLLMDSMRETRTSELVMIDRMFNNEEQMTINTLREQEAKINEEFKKEEKLLIPKTEPDPTDVDNLIPTIGHASVKLELEDDFDVDMDSKILGKVGGADYDEWLEIQKELGVYTSSSDLSRCRNFGVINPHLGNSMFGAKSTKTERTRSNGEYRISVSGSGISSNADLGNSDTMCNAQRDSFEHNCDGVDSDVVMSLADRRFSGTTELERDLLDDSESLDGLALYAQTQCPSSLSGIEITGGSNSNEHDDITAQVQSAIDSILSLKKRPSNTLSGSNIGSGTSQGSHESKEALIDQTVQSILGS